jgi:hypothetical protein
MFWAAANGNVNVEVALGTLYNEIFVLLLYYFTAVITRAENNRRPFSRSSLILRSGEQKLTQGLLIYLNG